MIKICGIKNDQEIALMNKVPVSYVGMIFAKSKRQVTIESAKGLRQGLRDDIKVVGVFQNNDMDFVREAAEEARLDVIQFHGNESNQDIIQMKALGYEVWKCLPIENETSLEALSMYEDADGFLLDTYHKGMTGGTGKVFNWDLVAGLTMPQKLILAGGLNPDNVIEAQKKVKPDILDLSSGLEVNLIKNEEKVNRLFGRLKEAYNE